MANWPLQSFWGAWKWSQWISHSQKIGNRHQNQVSSMCRFKVTNLAILFWLDKMAFWSLRCLKMVPMSLSCQKTWNRHQKQVSTAFRTKVINLSQIAEIWLAVMAIWPPRQIWGVWKWSQVIPHARKHGVWHQNQVSSLPRRKITNIPILRGMIFWTWSKRSTFESLNVGKSKK